MPRHHGSGRRDCAIRCERRMARSMWMPLLAQRQTGLLRGAVRMWNMMAGPSANSLYCGSRADERPCSPRLWCGVLACDRIDIDLDQTAYCPPELRDGIDSGVARKYRPCVTCMLRTRRGHGVLCQVETTTAAPVRGSKRPDPRSHRLKTELAASVHADEPGSRVDNPVPCLDHELSSRRSGPDPRPSGPSLTAWQPVHHSFASASPRIGLPRTFPCG